MNQQKVQAIHALVANGDMAGIKALLEEDPGLASASDERGDTPLHSAALWGRAEIAELLLDHGAEVNSGGNMGKPLHMAENAPVAEVLLAHGAEVNPRDGNGATPLHRAADRGSAAVAELLLAHGAEANPRNDYNETPLYYASRERPGMRTKEPLRKGRAEVAELLRRHGVR